MKQFTNFINKMIANEVIKSVVRGIAMWAMLLAILLFLLNTDFSTAPEFIYNQF